MDIGLKSFEAVALFAPAFLLGLYWKRGSRTGAIAGLGAGFAVWFYTLIIPALFKAGLLTESGVLGRLAASGLLDPNALFGVHGLGKWGNSLFWSMFLNLGLYVGISLATRPSREEEIQALLFVESDDRARELPLGASFTAADIEEILAQYVGAEQARAVVEDFLAQRGAGPGVHRQELRALRFEAERVLSGAIGSSLSSIIFEDKLVLSERERSELSSSLQQITASLRLSRQELAQTNLALSYLQEFSANIIESAPVGIASVDPSLRVNYWNRGMETLAGIAREAALDQPIDQLLPWLRRELLRGGAQREEIVQAPAQQCYRVNVSPFKDPSGGVVIIVEDITEKTKMEEQLLQSSKLASIGRLTAGISHEIGNPLASISSLVQELTALDGTAGEGPEFMRESLRSINGHLERISRIVRSLGDFARVSTARRSRATCARSSTARWSWCTTTSASGASASRPSSRRSRRCS